VRRLLPILLLCACDLLSQEDTGTKIYAEGGSLISSMETEADTDTDVDADTDTDTDTDADTDTGETGDTGSDT